jgi:hypothetical protein
MRICRRSGGFRDIVRSKLQASFGSERKRRGSHSEDAAIVTSTGTGGGLMSSPSASPDRSDRSSRDNSRQIVAANRTQAAPPAAITAITAIPSLQQQDSLAALQQLSVPIEAEDGEQEECDDAEQEAHNLRLHHLRRLR